MVQHFGSDVFNNIPTEILERMRRDGIDNNSYDSSGQGRSSDHSEDDTNPNLLFEGIVPDDNDNSIQIVNDLNRDYFREKLVQHFYIRWKNKDVFWPRHVNQQVAGDN